MFDEMKLKSLVVEKWRSGPDTWPVKAMSIARTVELERVNGGRKLDKVGGYFTCLRAIRGRTPREMEDILGFQPGYFASGVNVFKLMFLPQPDQFNLRGYTQCPGGSPFDGLVQRRAGLPRPEFFPTDGSPFVPGLAVEQWEIKENLLLAAFELECVLPGHRFTKWR